MTEDELAAWVALHAVHGMGAAALRRLVARFGSARAVLEAAPEERETVPQVPGLVLDGIRRAAGRESHRAVAARLLAEGVAPTASDGRAYPSRLHTLASPPPLLYVRGRLPAGQRPTIGIVGTTEPSPQGLRVAAAAARRLGRAGWVVVSGHARGIDAAAHRAALAAGRNTILVLPTGILRFRPRDGYPPPDRLWRLAAAVSELHPEAPWTAQNALTRNRVTAALSDAVLAVEMAESGGTVSTLRHAIGLGRRTFVVRYRRPALSASGNAGAEALGARPVRSLGELLRCLQQPPPRQPDLPWR